MHEPGLILTLTIGLSSALLLGYITQRLGLSPILGYLLAGIAVGPYTPGIFANTKLAGQLAEVGVILLMFGVGLHFRLKDLLAVKSIAIPGAIFQSTVATCLGVIISFKLGWKPEVGVVLGLAISVASTVVLMRVLQDNKMLDTTQGHVAVGWLIVEDIFTVLFLVLLPALFLSTKATASGSIGILLPLTIALAKMAVFAALMLLVGVRIIPWILIHVAQLKSRELFTLAVLVLALAIAVGASLLFGTSIELGAFLAGMVVGQSRVSHQAAADALPMRDAFAVLFFVSVGMLFDPKFVVESTGLVLSVLLVIMIGKPLAAVIIIVILGYPVRTMLTVAIGLAQIGEFSFILANMGKSLGILPDLGYNAVVACALFSIAVNPLLFRTIDSLEMWLKKRKQLWRLLTFRTPKYTGTGKMHAGTGEPAEKRPYAVVVGYGPVGQTVTRILKKFNIEPVVIELNIDTVKKLNDQGYCALFGDACQEKILQAAGIHTADFLLVTLPDLTSRIPVIVAARTLNPAIKIFVRARYLSERSMLEELGATAVCYEESEAAVTLAGLLLQDIGAPEEAIREEAEVIRREWSLRREYFKP